MQNGTGTTSLRKSDLPNQKIPATGFKKTVFAHRASVGEIGINLSSLTSPTQLLALGFVQPSASELASADLLFFRNNLRLISSARGALIDFMSYTVNSRTIS